MRKMGHQAIVFELGGVLLDSQNAIENAARQVATRLRLCVPEETWQSFRGVGYESFFGEVLSLPANKDCAVHISHVVSLAYDSCCEEIGRSARLFPNVPELLQLSRANFGRVAIATSCEWRFVAAAFKQFDLERYFDGVVSGDHLTQKKPAPEAYLVTAWLLGVKPTSMIAVENSVLGIRAARLARTPVIGVATTTDAQMLRDARADHVANDHGELLEYVRELARAGEKARA